MYAAGRKIDDRRGEDRDTNGLAHTCLWPQQATAGKP
jgi:hypothetical protein